MCVCRFLLVVGMIKSNGVYFIVLSLSKLKNLLDPSFKNSNWAKKLSPSSFQNRNLSRAQLTPSLPNMIEWYPINPSKKFAGERMSKFLHQLNESRLEARVPQLVEAGEDFDPRATSFRGEQFCVARLSTLFSKLKSRAEKFSFSHFSCVPYRCLMNEEACWSKPS